MLTNIGLIVHQSNLTGLGQTVSPIIGTWDWIQRKPKVASVEASGDDHPGVTIPVIN